MVENLSLVLPNGFDLMKQKVVSKVSKTLFDKWILQWLKNTFFNNKLKLEIKNNYNNSSEKWA